MLPIPQSRLEVLWNNIALGVSDNLPIPQSRLEVLVKALITNEIDNLPTPQSRAEMLLHAILKNEECNLNAQSRVELFLKAILNVDIENLPTPMSRIEVFLDYIARNGCLEKFEYYPFTFVNYLNVKNTANARMKIRSIKGNTLVNLIKSPRVLTLKKGEVDLKYLELNQNLKPNSTYTYSYELTELNSSYLANTVFFIITYSDNSKSYIEPPNKTTLGRKIHTFVTKNVEIKNVAFSIHTGFSIGDYAKVDDLMILEGDYTQNPPSYFENMLSVGQDNDNKIEVLSTNENIISDKLALEYGDFSMITGDIALSGDTSKCRCVNYIPIQPNTMYHLKFNSEIFDDYNAKVILFYDSNKQFISKHNESYQSPSNARYIRFRTRKIDNKIITIEELNNLKVSLCSSSEYVPYQSNKKEILLPHCHRGINDSICDEIVYLDETDLNANKGKGLYHIQRCGEVALNGSESGWSLNGISKYIQIAIKNKHENSAIICDTLPVSVIGASNPQNPIGVFPIVDPSGVRIKPYLKDDMTLEEGKAWLSRNPTKIVYQLAEPIYTKIEDINDLRSYENETNLFINGGAIAIMAEVEVGTKIGAIVSQLRKEVKEIDEQQSQHMKYVLNGDMRAIAEDLYPNDFEKDMVE